MYNDILNSDYILIQYGNDNHRMAETCSGGNLCIVFP